MITSDEVTKVAIARRKCWIQTNGGLPAYPLALTAKMVSVPDIAHALSHLCRFTGHVNRFLSVAEHCVHVSRVVPIDDAMAALFHDAAEAYLGDVAAPVKAFTILQVDGAMVPFGEVERRAHAAICEKVGISSQIPASVKVADLKMLQTERRLLLGKEPMPWQIEETPYEFDLIRCWGPAMAARQFLARYVELKEEM